LASAQYLRWMMHLASDYRNCCVVGPVLTSCTPSCTPKLRTVRTSHPARPPIHQPQSTNLDTPIHGHFIFRRYPAARAVWGPSETTPSVRFRAQAFFAGGAASGSGFFLIFCRALLLLGNSNAYSVTYEHAFTPWALGSSAFRVPLKLR
jgi:hypothetical protein